MVRRAAPRRARRAGPLLILKQNWEFSQFITPRDLDSDGWTSTDWSGLVGTHVWVWETSNLRPGFHSGLKATMQLHSWSGAEPI